MKLIILFTWTLLSVFNIAAESRLPQIVCRDARGNPFPLKLDKFLMDVDLQGDLTETTLTLTFRNETNRQLEGDFLLPLPPYAQITGYALEVNGAFREAVAVEKERAKFAYETIKRRGIDPGIVEKEADNLYRTRIFPIEPESTKSLRISYFEYLPNKSLTPSHLVYRYPFNLTTEVKKISVKVSGKALKKPTHPQLEFNKKSEHSFSAVLKQATLTEPLEIETRALLTSHLLRQEELAYLTINSQSLPEPTLHPTPNTVKILWDASRSINPQDIQKNFQYLDAFFAKVRNTDAQVYLLQNKNTKLGDFEVRNGDWTLLKAMLQEVDYDGASRLDQLETTGQDLTLLFTDGQFTHWPTDVSTLEPSRPLITLITSLDDQAPTLLRNLTNRSGGQLISLSSTALPQALEQTFWQSFRLQTTQRGIQIHPIPSDSSSAYRYLLKGKSLSPSKLQLANGRKSVDRFEIREEETPSPLLERLAAILELTRLETLGAPPAEIIAHCKEHTLVSDFTSLIVLEEFSDHLRFRIPPPEKDLLAKYEEKIESKQEVQKRFFSRIWREAIRLHQQEFPGAEVLLHHSLFKVRTLNQAQEAVFQPEDLDPELNKAFKDWEAAAYELIKQVQTKPSPKKDLNRIIDLRQKVTQLEQLQAAPKTPFAVSVRGHVQDARTITFEKNGTLKDAISQVKPIFRSGLTAVALYRSGKKTIYNTLSDQFADFHLLPGDMIVVEYPNFYDDWMDDPFADDDGSDSFASAPAIRESHPFFLTSTSSGHFGNDPFAGGSGNRPLGKIQVRDTSPLSIALRAIDLYKNNEKKVALRTLSNLRELFPKDHFALRLEAYILSQWDLPCEGIYQQLLHLDPTDHLTTHLYTNYLLSNNREKEAQAIFQIYFQTISAWASYTPSLILISDRNRSIKNPSKLPEKNPLPKDLRIVITNLHPDPFCQLRIVDPLACSTAHNQTSPTGLSLTSCLGLTEISVRNALSGSYKLYGQCHRDQLLEVILYRHFSTAKEEIERKLIILPANQEEQLLDTILFGIEPKEEE